MKLITISIAACLIAACDKQQTTTGDPAEENSSKTGGVTAVTTGEAKEPCCSKHPSPEALEPSESSIYQIESVWQDDTGTDRQLKSLGGRVQVISMGYSTCQFACPRLLAGGFRR